MQRADDGRLAIRLGDDTFAATVVRRPTADGVDYTLFADGTSRRLRLVDPLDVTQYEAAGCGARTRCARRCPARSSISRSRSATR